MKKRKDETNFHSLTACASTALVDCLQVDPGEKALIVFDKSAEEIADAFTQAALESELKLARREIEPTGANGADPDPKTCAMMLKYDVIIAPTLFSLTHCAAMTKARKAGARSATLPGCTSDIFERGMKISPYELSAAGRKWLDRLSGPRSIRVVSKAGTDISFKTGLAPFKNDDGLINRAGLCGNLPAGEVFAAPDAGTANGRIVIDGSIGSFQWKEGDGPAIIEVKDGKAVEFSGERGSALRDALFKAGEGGFVLAEFGIGTNPQLHLGGNLLEDEKVKGTIHLAFGNNTGFGGINDVPVHIDGLVLSPDVFADGVQLMRNGDWLI